MNVHVTSNTARQSQRLRLERRLSQRFSPRRVMTAQLELVEDGPTMMGVVQNLSGRGISLVCPWSCTLGRELRLRMLSAAATAYLVVTIRVVRCEPMLTGGYLLGCEFTRALDPGELRPFLA